MDFLHNAQSLTSSVKASIISATLKYPNLRSSLDSTLPVSFPTYFSLYCPHQRFAKDGTNCPDVGTRLNIASDGVLDLVQRTTFWGSWILKEKKRKKKKFLSETDREGFVRQRRKYTL